MFQFLHRAARPDESWIAPEGACTDQPRSAFGAVVLGVLLVSGVLLVVGAALEPLDDVSGLALVELPVEPLMPDEPLVLPVPLAPIDDVPEDMPELVLGELLVLGVLLVLGLAPMLLDDDGVELVEPAPWLVGLVLELLLVLPVELALVPPEPEPEPEPLWASATPPMARAAAAARVVRVFFVVDIAFNSLDETPQGIRLNTAGYAASCPKSTGRPL